MCNIAKCKFYSCIVGQVYCFISLCRLRFGKAKVINIFLINLKPQNRKQKFYQGLQKLFITFDRMKAQKSYGYIGKLKHWGFYKSATLCCSFILSKFISIQSRSKIYCRIRKNTLSYSIRLKCPTLLNKPCALVGFHSVMDATTALNVSWKPYFCWNSTSRKKKKIRKTKKFSI